MPLYDQDKAVKKAVVKHREARKRESLAMDTGLKSFVETYEGRRYIWWLLEITKALGHNAFAETPERTAFNCGQQNVGQQILHHLIEVAPDAYLKLLKEQYDERYSDTAPGGTDDDSESGSGSTDPYPDTYT